MTARPYAWCAVLAAADDDVLGTVLREVCERTRPKTPGLLRIGHRRVREADDGGERWWLHVGVVFDGGSEEGASPLEDSHPALAREVQHAVDRWAHAWPILHRHARGDAALRRYHRAPEGVVLPAPPPGRTAVATLLPRAPAPKPEPPTPPPAPPPSTQGSLFG